ncbi:hypothetical protein RUM43_009720 [Polyplax serrata]|uniref:Sodium/nucleoside cotransporter n=1 Tax=Polyplax serrata TaxID=468196 RepID=A0AAN8P362_POLSC
MTNRVSSDETLKVKINLNKKLLQIVWAYCSFSKIVNFLRYGHFRLIVLIYFSYLESKTYPDLDNKEVLGQLYIIVKVSDTLELNNKLSNDIASGRRRPLKDGDEEETTNHGNINFLAQTILKARSRLKQLFPKGSTSNRALVLSLTHVIALAILIASIVKYVKLRSPRVEWCDGFGLLWVLYILVYITLTYSFFKKRIVDSCGHVLGRATLSLPSWVNANYLRGFCYAFPVIALGVYVIIFPGKSRRRIISFSGMLVFILIGFVFSKYPGNIKWRTVISGIVLQFIVGLLAINWEAGRNVLDCMGNKVTRFLLYSEDGANFVYGPLTKPQKDSGLIFAFSVLPVIFFLSFFVNILSYYGILQWFILKISWIVKLAMGTTVYESVNAAASIFLGMSEAPLLIKNHLKDLTKSELCAIMCAGWSTVAGVVLAAYIKFGVKASHLISASIMSAPASLSYSKLFYPETEKSKNTLDQLTLEREEGSNALDAACKGAVAAISVVFGIIANIIAILSFLAFTDGVLGWLGPLIGFDELSMKWIMSKLFVPISFFIGTDLDSIEDVAYLIGIKTVANEFQAYQKLGEWIDQKKLTERSEILATYALCGFSNFGSIGISIGALTAIEPSQRSAITKVAFRAFVAANIVCFLTACVAGRRVPHRIAIRQVKDKIKEKRAESLLSE